MMSTMTYSQDQVPSNEAGNEKVWDWTTSGPMNDKKWAGQESFAFHSKRKWQTDAVLIIKDDNIVYEKYAHGFTQNKPHRLWSISKSFASALIGKRLSQKGWPIIKKASEVLEELNKPIKKNITFRDFLQMSSGLAWNEFYEGNPFESHVVDMLYIENFKDMGLFTATREARARPGKIFNYSSGETNLLMKLLKQTFPTQEEYDNYPWDVLFNPLGITTATWEQDQAGNFVGSSYLFMTTRDLARFGRLYIKKGQWNKDKQIIPQNFVTDSLKVAPTSCQTYRKAKTDSLTYGYHWWLNQECPEKKKRSVPGVTNELFMALGHQGQVMAIFPKEKAIAIRLGADKLEKFDRNSWIKKVYKELEGH